MAEEVVINNIVDLAMKRIVRNHPTLMLRLLNIPRDTSYRFEDAVLVPKEFRADHILLLQNAEKEDTGAYYWEYVMVPDKRDHSKWITKWGTLRSQLGLPVCLVVIYLERGNYATFPSSIEDNVGGWKTRVEFVRILLWEIGDRIRSGELVELAPLLYLTQDNPQPAVLEEEVNLIQTAEIPESLKEDLLALAMRVAARRFAKDIILAIFQEKLTMKISDSDIIGEWIEAAAEEATIKEELSNTRIITIEILTLRLGDLPEPLVQKINSSTKEWCRNLLRQGSSVESLTELDWE